VLRNSISLQFHIRIIQPNDNMGKKFYPIFLFFLAVTSLNAQNFKSPALWFKVNSDSINTEYWNDFSGNERHALLPEGVSDSIHDINFNPARKFNRNGFGEISYNPDGVSELIFMAVFQPVDTAEMGLLTSKNTLKRDFSFSTQRAIGPDSLVHQFSEGNLMPQMTTVTQVWEDANEKSEDGYLSFLEARNDQGSIGYNGYLAELILFDQPLTFLESLQWETYLAIKYGISLHSKNYVSSSEMVLWDFEEFEEFGHRITGLGRDDLFGLNQQRSVNVEDTLTLLKFNVGNFDDTISNTFPDQNFWLFGDDNASLEANKGTGKDSILTIVDRKWLNTTNGNQAKTTFTSLALDYKQLPNDSLGFWLVLDRSGQSDFSVDVLEYIEPDSITTDSIAIYNDINWDVDGSGQDNFSFAKIQELFAAVRIVDLPTCTDTQSGLVSIDVIKGDGPYTFEWVRMDGAEDKLTGSFKEEFEIDQLAQGDYKLTLKDKHGLTFTRHFNLPLANDIPVNLGPDQRISEGEDIVLDASELVHDSLDVSYFWEGSFGFTATTKEITVSEPGAYRVYVTNKSNGCVFEDDIAIEGSNIKRIGVYPNPVLRNSTFKVSISLRTPEGIEVNLLDVKGNIHQSLSKSGKSEYLLDVKVDQAGQYVIMVVTDSGTEAKKIAVY